MPLRDPQGALDFEEILVAIVESGFGGSLTLEYLHQFHDHLVADALLVQIVLDRLVAGE